MTEPVRAAAEARLTEIMALVQKYGRAMANPAAWSAVAEREAVEAALRKALAAGAPPQGDAPRAGVEAAAEAYAKEWKERWWATVYPDSEQHFELALQAAFEAGAAAAPAPQGDAAPEGFPYTVPGEEYARGFREAIEEAAKRAEAEEEPTGPMPDEVRRLTVERPEDSIRAVVRATKKGIAAGIRALAASSPRPEAAPDAEPTDCAECGCPVSAHDQCYGACKGRDGMGCDCPVWHPRNLRPAPPRPEAPTSPPWHPEYVKGWHAARAPAPAASPTPGCTCGSDCLGGHRYDGGPCVNQLLGASPTGDVRPALCPTCVAQGRPPHTAGNCPHHPPAPPAETTPANDKER